MFRHAGLVALVLVAPGCAFWGRLTNDYYDSATNPSSLSEQSYRQWYVKQGAPPGFATKILEGKITRGMSQDDVRAAWGLQGRHRPYVIQHNFEWGIVELWRVPGKLRNPPAHVLRFVNGVLESWSNY